jgi:hypothetical protein
MVISKHVMGKRGIFQITMNSLFICTFTERRRPPPGGDGTGDAVSEEKYNKKSQNDIKIQTSGVRNIE